MKKNSGGRAAAFLNGKGFYVVLFLCIAAIGISAYVVYLTGSITGGQLEGEFSDFDLDGLLKNDNKNNDDFLASLDMNNHESEGEADTVSSPVDSIPAETVTDKPGPDTSDKTRDTVSVSDNVPFFVMPVDGMIINPFSDTELVFNHTLGDWRTHNGTDIAGKPGDPVSSMADGTVESIYTDSLMGRCVVIAHGGGYKSLYANLQENVVVKEGETVHAGTVIGGIGATAVFEALMEPHVHVEVTRDGEYVDPMSLIEQPWAEPTIVDIDE